MHQTIPILAFLTLLCFQANTLPLLESCSLRKNNIMNAHATSSGIIDIKKDSYDAFYVEADLFDSCSSQSSSSNATRVDSQPQRMMISIANSETMVATHCLEFNSYTCSDPCCQTYDYFRTIDYPTFTAKVQDAKGSMFLDYDHWSLTTAYLYIASDCQTGDGSSHRGEGKFGVVGLGILSGARSDFISDVMFSIWLNSDLSAGKLLFKKDTDTYAQSSTPLATLSVNATWQTKIDIGKFELNGNSFEIPGNLMFDINSNAIGLPQAYFKVLVNTFALPLGIWCFEDLYRPICYYTGPNPSKTVEDLPDITLWVNDIKITIPWEVYATPVNSTKFYFNFKATGVDLTSSLYVSPSFANSIILDAHFMSYYYTVFDSTGDSTVVQLYLSKKTPADSNLALWVAGAFGVAVLVGIGFYVKKKKSMANKGTDSSAFIPTTQAPIIYSQQPQGTYIPPQERAKQEK